MDGEIGDAARIHRRPMIQSTESSRWERDLKSEPSPVQTFTSYLQPLKLWEKCIPDA